MDFRFRFAKDVAAVLRGDVSRMFPIVIALYRRYAGHKRPYTGGNQAAQDVPRCRTARSAAVASNSLLDLLAWEERVRHSKTNGFFFTFAFAATRRGTFD